MNPLPYICSITEAAKILGLSEERVLQFARQGRIDGKQLKREWVLSWPSVRMFAKRERKTGRPKKSAC